MSEIFKTPLFRGSYVNLITPKVPKGSDDAAKPKYSITVVLKKANKEHKQFLAKLEAAMFAASLEKHGKKIPKEHLKHWPIRDGDKPDEDGEVDPNLEGCWAIIAKSDRKPKVVGTDRQFITDEEQLYSGAWYKVTMNCYAWTHPVGGKGVSLGLGNVIKMKDDTPIGGGASDPNDDFDDDFLEGDDTVADNDNSDELEF